MSKTISLTKGRVAIVSDEDYERVVEAGPWCLATTKHHFYAKRGSHSTGRHKTIFMHNFITGWSMVDHMNRNGLDNRRSNLRLATRSQNQWNQSYNRRNTSGYKGVYWDKNRRKWAAQISVYGKRYALGRYENKEEAARAYDRAAIEFHGEFARVNFPIGGGRDTP